jgi:hypothetical protein
MKGVFKGILVLIILAVVVGGVAFFAVPMNNKLVLNKFSRQLKEAELPESTELIASEQQYGRLIGDKNGLDFLAVIIIKSELSITQLKEFYNEKVYFNAKDTHNEIDLYIYNMESSSINNLIELNTEVSFDELSGITDLSDYYAIILIDAGYPAGLDHNGYGF